MPSSLFLVRTTSLVVVTVITVHLNLLDFVPFGTAMDRHLQAILRPASIKE
jgi:hypothetical protein